MSTTITLGGSISWAQSFAGFKSFTIGTASEPAVTSGNMILQTVIGPPFIWNWNRATASFLTTIGIQDYAQTLANFGFIEKAGYVPAATITSVTVLSNVATYTTSSTLPTTITDSFTVGAKVTVTGCTTPAYNVTGATITAVTTNTFSVALVSANATEAESGAVAISGQVSEISKMFNVLGSGSESGPPNNLAAQIDNNAGVITFRILPSPDQIYQVTIIYQKRIPSLMTTTSSTWAPIPDHYSYIYQWGFLALMQAYNNDSRWASSNQKFVSALLGAAEGLSEDQKNAFQAAWLSTMANIQTNLMTSQQGVQGRGV